MSDSTLQDIPSSSSCEDLVQCVFNLNPLEVKIYQLLVSEGPLRADEVGKRVNRDRSTAYRCLRHLMTCNMCYKEQKYLEQGGYYYVYTAEPPEEVQKKLVTCIETWHGKMKKAVDQFVERFDLNNIQQIQK